MEFYDFPFSWECHHLNWRTPIFQRGRYTTNQIKFSLLKSSRIKLVLVTTGQDSGGFLHTQVNAYIPDDEHGLPKVRDPVDAGGLGR